MTLEPHVHCAECQCAIETTVIAKDGKRKPAQIEVGYDNRVIPAPQGLAVAQVKVPLCKACKAKIIAQEQRQQATSKLILPTGPSARTVPNLHEIPPLEPERPPTP